MMNQEEEMSSTKQNKQEDDDDHENDMVMPGFRFHPTEEELVEFYLRRKVEGKRFNVELITFLDLYRYDPWELPALAAIGEKEWFFYVPRDRKYRNGDRPNRVTTSGYWKATGADRMIRTENSRSIGLKKTLVFYSGKAPKGIRTSWIMNEYRLPHQETERLQKAEISLCRVYKRAGVEDHPSLPRTLPTTRATSSRTSHGDKKQHSQNLLSFHSFEGQNSNQNDDKLSETSGSSSTDIVGTALGLSSPLNPSYNNFITSFPSMTTTLRPQTSSLIPHCTPTASSSVFPNSVDDLHRIISYQQASVNNPASHAFHIHNYQPKFSNNLSHHFSPNNLLPQPQLQSQPLQPQSQMQPHSQALLALNNLAGEVQVTFPDRIWEWNPMPSEGNKDYTNPFK